ncbi:MAG: RAMP superfamily CRISPR-associated protein [Ferrovibrio sp.]
MKTFDSYLMHITPLSPVHIGTGESFEPTNYVIDDGILYEFDTGGTIAALTATERKELLAIANLRPDAGMILALQRFFYERRETLMAHAVQQVPVLPGVAALYDSRIGQTANIEADGKKVLNRLEIDRTSFNPVTRQPVLYGSSLKGAIRTALLDKINGGASLQKVEDRHTGKRRDENNQELQNRLFQYRPGKFERDPMRLVRLADATWRGEPGLPATQVHLAVNRKKAPVVDEKGGLRKSMAESKELYQILECVSGWHYRAFAGQLNLQSVSGLAETHAAKLPAAHLRFDARQIAQACNRFYRPILNAENQLLRGRGYLDPDWDKAVSALLAQADDKMRRGDAFLLRVGRHSGAESVTLNGAREGHIKILLDKDPETKKQRFAYESEARSLWLAANDKDQMTGLLPFGWLLVELQPMGASDIDWPELKAACEPHLSAARAFRDKLAAQQTRLEQAKAEAEAKCREEEEQARRAAEAEAQRQREEAERQARLAALSENMRRIEAFKDEFKARMEQLRGSKDRPNTLYHDKARRLARDALEGADWSAEEKRAAAEAIAEWLPRVVAVEMKEERKKLKLSVLRAES